MTVINFRHTLLLSLLAVSINVFAAGACPKALPTDNVAFCPSFKSAAACNCTANGQGPAVCQNMKKMYALMLSMFGDLKSACNFQHNTSAQECIDDWNCYISGGKDSQGRACASSGKACE